MIITTIGWVWMGIVIGAIAGGSLASLIPINLLEGLAAVGFLFIGVKLVWSTVVKPPLSE